MNVYLFAYMSYAMWEIDPDALRRAMGAANVNQSELAAAVGLQQPSIGRLLSGETKTSRKIDGIAAALGVPAGSLMKGAPEFGSAAQMMRDRQERSAFAENQLSYRASSSQRRPDMVEVAGIDLNFGLGGAFMDQEIVEHQAEQLLFPAAWLRQITTTPAEHLYWTAGVGNSMEPAISDGDVILIDRSKVGSSFGDLYWAIAYGQTGMIKRLRPMPDGSVKILSDNQSVPPEIAYDGELHIFGRVVAVIKRI